MRRSGVFIALAIALMATGCTTHSLEELRRTTPGGTPFQNALAQKYLDFAENEAKNYDWWSQMHFADKGLASAYGKETSPEELEGWNIPSHAQARFAKAREALLAVLATNAAEKNPELAADAQFNFDCWLEQQHENWQDDDIAHCRDGFAVAMQKLAGNYKEETQQELPAMETPAIPTLARAKDIIAYVVFFEWNQSVMSEQGKKITDEVIGLLKDQDRYEVILNGHNDTAEAGKGDFELSQRRADAVRQRLVEGGVKDEAIQVFAFGSSDPHVKTAPKVKEPANRRVEIFLND